jgi:hypothetical protein
MKLREGFFIGIEELNKPVNEIDWEKAFIEFEEEVKVSIAGICVRHKVDFLNWYDDEYNKKRRRTTKRSLVG